MVSIRIVYIRDSKSKGYLTLGVESDGKIQSLTISEREYRALSEPRVRDEITSEVYEQILRIDMQYRAKLKALNILSYGDNSKKNLKRKLLLAKIDSETVEKTVSEMASYGYIDEMRQIKKLILNEYNLHNSGPRKIIPKLVAKGYSADDIRAALSELEQSSEIDFDLSKKRLLDAKLPPLATEEDKKKILYKNGYFVC